MRSTLTALVAVAVSLACADAVASCGSAFCMVNTNWGVQGLWNEPGLRADLRYEYIDQDQPRTGTQDIAVGAMPRHHDEVRTVNRNLFATVDYGLSETIGFSLVVPWVDREHEHIHNHHGEQILESWKFSDLGDMRLTARYQFPATPIDASATRASTFGVTGGLKLPTGKTTVTNGEGDPAERSLQPGTGTTDLLLGAYYRELIGPWNASWFVQANAQVALNEHDDYRPGSQVLLDAGVRWEATDRLGVLLQLNGLWRGHDSGAAAEPEDSGSRTLSVSPGITFALTPQFQVYAFVQLPVYQRVTGVQLVADRAVVVGASAQF
jgi:hypothetical protein